MKLLHWVNASRALVLLFSCTASPLLKADEPEVLPTYLNVRQLALIDDKRIHESSGLAASPTRDGIFWTHNDSGDDENLFAVDMHGRVVQHCQVSGARNIDWEDLCAFRRNDKSYLLIADTGNFRNKRGHGTLYLVPEPSAGENRPQVEQKVEFQFPDSARDCESVAFDPETNQVLLVEKSFGSTKCQVFALDWPKPGKYQLHVAQAIGTLELFAATGMDISPDSRRAVVCNYFGATEVYRGESEDWKTAFSRPGKSHSIPGRTQGEAICYGRDGRFLYLTTEGQNSPLFEVQPGPCRNPFREIDVPDPFAEDVIEFGNKAALPHPLKKIPATWRAWLPAGDPNSLEGKWSVRWGSRRAADDQPGKPTTYDYGTAQIREKDGRVYLLCENSRVKYLIEARPEQDGRFVGRYRNLRLAADSGPWAGVLVGKTSIDGMRPGFDWDFRRIASDQVPDKENASDKR